MVQIALVFVGFAILVFLLLLAAAVYFIPRVLEAEAHGKDENGQTSHGRQAG
jgi:Na+-transporting methylmalonyl-CoA/oxaloacetate decarboxylase gamma subunit